MVDKMAIYGIIACESVLSKTRGEHGAHSPFRGKTPQGVCLMLTQRELAEGLTHVSDRCGGCSGPGVVSMSPRKIKALFRQFPWVREHVPGGGIKQFHVVRVEREILDYKPEPLPVGEDRNHDALYLEKLWLLDAGGEKIFRTAQVVTKYRKFLFGPVKEKIQPVTFTGLVEDCTVRETFEALREAGKRVQFILSCSHSTQVVIVYTMPKGMSFGEWMNREFEAEKVAAKEQAQVVSVTKISKEDVQVVVAPSKTSKEIVPVGDQILARMSPLVRVVVQNTRF